MGRRGFVAEARGAERRRIYNAKETLRPNRVLTLTPFPSLPDEASKRQTWFRKIEQEIVEETRERHRAEGITCGPPEALCHKNPRYAPEQEDCSPAQMCHTACKDRRKAFRKIRRAFVGAWREALKDFKRGLRVCFPPGGWWPFHCREVAAPQRV